MEACLAEYIRRNNVKICAKTVPHLRSLLKKKIWAVLLCIRRMEKTLEKKIPKHIKLVILDYCFSPTALIGM